MSECILGRGQRKKISARVFIRSPKKKEIQTEPEAFYKIEEEKERDDGLLTLFFTAEKTPLSFEEEGHALRHTHTKTHTLPTLFERREGQRHTHTHTHARKGRTRAFKKRRRDTPVTRGSARARDATGGQGERTLNCRRHARVGSRRGRQRRRRRRRTFKVDDVDSKRCWRSETPVR